MKVIDLLNKIANGEICTGTHVIYRDREYIFTGSDLENIKEKYAIAMFGLDNLNNEVEIIEDKKIPERVLNAKVFDVPKLNNMELSNIVLTNKEDIKIIKDTLNKVLDYLESKGE